MANQPASPAPNSSRPRRRWIWLVFLGLAAAATVVVAFAWGSGSSLAPAVGNDLPNLAEVIVTDLTQQESYQGTLGSVQDDPVLARLAGTITQIAAAGKTIQQGQSLFAIDDRPMVLLYGELPAYRDIAIGEETIIVAGQLPGQVTWAPEPGTVIQQGDVLYRVDDRPVILLYGEQPAYRDLALTEPDLTAIASLAAADASVASAEASCQSARAQLEELLAGPSPETLAQAQLAVDQARNSLWAAQANRDAICGQDDDSAACNGANATVANQEIAVQLAEISLASMQQALDDEAIVASQAAVEAAEAQLAQAQASVEAQLAALSDEQTALDAEAVAPQAGYDVVQLVEALLELGYGLEGAQQPAAFTPAVQALVENWQADTGAEADGVVNLGEVLFAPAPVQVLEVLTEPGSPATGALLSVSGGRPASGEVVRQLEQALLDLGHDADGALLADGVYDLDTYQAVLAFQAAVGLEPDGIIDLGEVTFLPQAVRVTDKRVAAGQGISPGQAVLAISLSDKVVKMALPAKDQGVLSLGEPVMVEMPDLAEVPATVTYVAQNATVAQGGATFEVRIALDDPTVAEGLDEAPVDVTVISDRVENVMAVPVSALLALLEGGYAVEVDMGGGRTQLVAVEVGFYGSDNLVEVRSEALRPGDRVVVP